MKVMTFNIRNAIADDGENSWKYRKNAVFDYLSKSNAEIICMQEVVPEVKKEMQASLADKYSFIGKIGFGNSLLEFAKKVKLLKNVLNAYS